MESIDFKLYEYEIEVDYYIQEIPSYGSDMDGNRGSDAKYVEVKEITVYLDGKDVTKDIEKYKELWQEIEDEAYDKIV